MSLKYLPASTAFPSSQTTLRTPRRVRIPRRDISSTTCHPTAQLLKIACLRMEGVRSHPTSVYLVRSVSADKLVERIKKGNIIARERVLHDMNKANADPDIAATSIRMSLKDPVSTMRISIPVRSSHCTHNQCFDGAMFLQLQEQAPQWSCPVCSKHVSFESLCVDKYFEDILNRTSRSIEKVDIEPNGDWKVIKDEEETQPNGTSSKARASYDDDFDDLVELDQPAVNKPVNGVKRDSYPQNLAPFPGPALSFSTPPLSSREPSVPQSNASTSRPGNKRPQSAVIDLTLSDDEDDDPPRPAKRQSTINAQRSQPSNRSNHTNSYNSPTSLPDSRYQPYQQQQQNYNQNYNNHNQADTYRPASTHHSNTYTSTNNYNPQISVSPANPVSPFGQPAMPAQHARPPAEPNQNQPSASIFPSGPTSPYSTSFAMRPASTSQTPTTGRHGGLRLPPMQTHQQSSSPESNQNLFQGWRSDWDYGHYGSSSPG
jgi:E3 SUMO-protein ligase PIAS1